MQEEHLDFEMSLLSRFERWSYLLKRGMGRLRFRFKGRSKL